MSEKVKPTKPGLYWRYHPQLHDYVVSLVISDGERGLVWGDMETPKERAPVTGFEGWDGPLMREDDLREQRDGWKRFASALRGDCDGLAAYAARLRDALVDALGDPREVSDDPPHPGLFYIGAEERREVEEVLGLDVPRAVREAHARNKIAEDIPRLADLAREVREHAGGVGQEIEELAGSLEGYSVALAELEGGREVEIMRQVMKLLPEWRGNLPGSVLGLLDEYEDVEQEGGGQAVRVAQAKDKVVEAARGVLEDRVFNARELDRLGGALRGLDRVEQEGGERGG